MKTFLAIGLTLLLGAFGAIRLHANRVAADLLPAVEHSSSSSQIYIHGTPVCVFNLDGNIVAKVGPCAEEAGPESDSPSGKAPFSGNPSLNLPPGHPPVSPDMSIEDPRRILI